MPQKTPADLILHNGQIITVNKNDEILKAVVIKDGKITYVGDDATALSYAGAATEIFDLDGKTVTPGLIDSHIHMQWVGKALQQINCRSPPITSIKDLQEEVRKKVVNAKPGEWIIGRGWDQVKLAEHRYPVKTDFDEIAPDNPVVLFRVCEHLAVVNTRALELAGITRDTVSPPGGKVAKDTSGEPTGMLEELPALSLITSIMPMETEAVLVDAVETACHEFNKVGITGVLEPGLTPIEMRAYQQAELDGRLSIRVNMMYMGNYQEITVPDLVKRIEGFQWKNGFGTSLLKFFGLKMFMDGGYGGKTAYTRTPYPDEPDNYGLRIMDSKDFQTIVDVVNMNNTRMAVHCCGGAAMDVVLEAYKKSDKKKSLQNRRFQIIHAYHPSEENIDTIKRLGVSVVSQPGFIYYLGDSYVENLGKERIQSIKPLRTLFDEAIPVAGSSDGPVTPFNPWMGIWAATTRKTEVSGEVLGEDQRITRLEALRMYTMNGAYATFDENVKGSIETGKYADMLVLDRDFLTCSDDDVKDTKVLATYLSGRKVYETS